MDFSERIAIGKTFFKVSCDFSDVFKEYLDDLYKAYFLDDPSDFLEKWSEDE